MKQALVLRSADSQTQSSLEDYGRIKNQIVVLKKRRKKRVRVLNREEFEQISV